MTGPRERPVAPDSPKALGENSFKWRSKTLLWKKEKA